MDENINLVLLLQMVEFGKLFQEWQGRSSEGGKMRQVDNVMAPSRQLFAVIGQIAGRDHEAKRHWVLGLKGIGFSAPYTPYLPLS